MQDHPRAEETGGLSGEPLMNKATTVLAERSEQIVTLVRSSNALLAELRTQTAALDAISGNISALSRQLQGFIAEHPEVWDEDIGE